MMGFIKLSGKNGPVHVSYSSINAMEEKPDGTTDVICAVHTFNVLESPESIKNLIREDWINDGIEF